MSRISPSLIRQNQPFRERLQSASYTPAHLTARNVEVDHKIRALAYKHLPKHSIARVIIERIGNKGLCVNIQTHKSNMLAGENGVNLDKLRTEITKSKIAPNYPDILVGLLPVENSEADAQVVCNNIVEAIEISRGKNYMRMIKDILATVKTNSGILGISIRVAGRMNGASIASDYKVAEGTTRLQSVNADIVRAVGAAKTPTGMMGVSVVISRVAKDRTRDAFQTTETRTYSRPGFNKPRFNDRFTRDRAEGSFRPKTFESNTGFRKPFGTRPPRFGSKPNTVNSAVIKEPVNV